MVDKRTLPAEREAITRRFEIGKFQGYAIVGLYPDGRPGEIFLYVHNVGSIERGLCNSLALMASKALQRGVPIQDICDGLVGQKFEPSGVTGDREFPMVHSFADYLGRWMQKKWGTECSV